MKMLIQLTGLLPPGEPFAVQLFDAGLGCPSVLARARPKNVRPYVALNMVATPTVARRSLGAQAR